MRNTTCSTTCIRDTTAMSCQSTSPHGLHRSHGLNPQSCQSIEQRATECIDPASCHQSWTKLRRQRGSNVPVKNLAKTPLVLSISPVPTLATSEATPLVHPFQTSRRGSAPSILTRNQPQLCSFSCRILPFNQIVFTLLLKPKPCPLVRLAKLQALFCLLLKHPLLVRAPAPA